MKREPHANHDRCKRIARGVALIFMMTVGGEAIAQPQSNPNLPDNIGRPQVKIKTGAIIQKPARARSAREDFSSLSGATIQCATSYSAEPSFDSFSFANTDITEGHGPLATNDGRVYFIKFFSYSDGYISRHLRRARPGLNEEVQDLSMWIDQSLIQISGDSTKVNPVPIARGRDGDIYFASGSTRPINDPLSIRKQSNGNSIFIDEDNEISAILDIDYESRDLYFLMLRDSGVREIRKFRIGTGPHDPDEAELMVSDSSLGMRSTMTVQGGSLFYTPTYYRTIRKRTFAGETTTVVGVVGGAGTALDEVGETAPALSFVPGGDDIIKDITSDKCGNLYFLAGQNIYRFSPTPNEVTLMLKDLEDSPRYLILDGSDNLYVLKCESEGEGPCSIVQFSPASP